MELGERVGVRVRVRVRVMARLGVGVRIRSSYHTQLLYSYCVLFRVVVKIRIQ